MNEWVNMLYLVFLASVLKNLTFFFSLAFLLQAFHWYFPLFKMHAFKARGPRYRFIHVLDRVKFIYILWNVWAEVEARSSHTGNSEDASLKEIEWHLSMHTHTHAHTDFLFIDKAGGCWCQVCVLPQAPGCLSAAPGHLSAGSFTQSIES